MWTISDPEFDVVLTKEGSVALALSASGMPALCFYLTDEHAADMVERFKRALSIRTDLRVPRLQ